MQPLQPKTNANFLSRVLGYFVQRKKKFGVLAAVAFLLYVAQKRGYVTKVFLYSLKKVEERMMKQMEESQREMEKKNQKSAEFGATLKEHFDKIPQVSEMHLARLADERLDLAKSKEAIRNKSLSSQEKTKQWQLFKVLVLKQTFCTLVLKGYLATVLLVKDLLMAKLNAHFQAMIEANQQKEPKFLSDSIESTRTFLDKLTDSLINLSVSDVVHFVEKIIARFEYKLMDKLAVEDFIGKLEEVKQLIFSKDEVEGWTRPDYIDLNLRKCIEMKKCVRFQLIHKRVMPKPLSFRGLMSVFYKKLFTSTQKIQTRINNTSVTNLLLGKFVEYKLDTKEGTISNYLFCITRGKACDKLSTITEFDEKAEDGSEIIEDLANKPQVVYEEASSSESKDFEHQQKIVTSLENIISNYVDDLLDLLTTPNTQLVMETHIELNFKKLANRLLLLKDVSKDMNEKVTFMLLIGRLSKLIDEEFVDKNSFKNDQLLFQSRAKELFALANKDASDPALTAASVPLNIAIAEEAKIFGLLQRASREFAARLYFEEEFEQFYGDEFEKPKTDKKSPSNDEQQDLMQMLSRLDASKIGQLTE